MLIPPQVHRPHSCLQGARVFPLRLPEVIRIGGKGSSKCAASSSKGRALLVSGVADRVAEDSVADRVAEDSAVGEVDSVAAEDSVVGEGLEVEGIGREAGRG